MEWPGKSGSVALLNSDFWSALRGASREKDATRGQTVSTQGKAGSTTELADRVKAILASRQLSLHQASQKSARLFGRSSPYYLPHNLYYDLSHGRFSPSLYQLVALSTISNYRLRDWLRVF